MRVRFLRDFRSAATNEEFYAKGQVADLDRGREIVAEGAAEAVPLTAREGQATPLTPPIPPEGGARGGRAPELPPKRRP